MTEKCPKCQREWKGQAPCDQTVCIEMFGECIPCRFLPTTHPNNTRGSGSGTDADLKAIETASKAVRAKVGADETATPNAELGINNGEHVLAQLEIVNE